MTGVAGAALRLLLPGRGDDPCQPAVGSVVQGGRGLSMQSSFLFRLRARAARLIPATLAAAAATAVAQPAAADGPHGFSVDLLSYNVYLRPLLPDDQAFRAPRIGPELKGYDLVLLQEVFSDSSRRRLLDALGDAYPHRSRVLGRDSGVFQDGGVMILSEWPIEAEAELTFGATCAGADCLADKGVLYARINKQGHRLHVFATHLQASKRYRAVRERQIRALRAMIDEMDLPADEPVLIGGDLNVNRFADPETGAFTAMTNMLDATHPAPPAGGIHEPTKDAARNQLVYGTSHRLIDYLLYSNRHLRPVAAFNQVRRPRAEGRDLSDHFPVHGRFVFETPDGATDRRRLAAIRLPL